VLYRVNVIFAALTMNADLGFSPLVYACGAGIFFIGYFILEIPSNLARHRFGARRRIARIMIVWGVVSARLAFVTGPNSFLAAVSDSRPRSKKRAICHCRINGIRQGGLADELPCSYAARNKSGCYGRDRDADPPGHRVAAERGDLIRHSKTATKSMVSTFHNQSSSAIGEPLFVAPAIAGLAISELISSPQSPSLTID
jgi:hypothetical protein